MDKNKLKRLADYAVREGTEHTTDGRWSVSYDELYYRFGEAVTDTNENGKLLEEELRQREEINALIMTEDRKSVPFHSERRDWKIHAGQHCTVKLQRMSGHQRRDIFCSVQRHAK